MRSSNSPNDPTQVVIKDGSDITELRPESLEEPILETEAHRGSDKAPANIN